MGLGVKETKFKTPFLARKMLNERVSRQSVFLCCFAFAANWTLRKSLRFDPSLQHAPRWKILEIQDLLDVRFLEIHVRKIMHEFHFSCFSFTALLTLALQQKTEQFKFFMFLYYCEIEVLLFITENGIALIQL